MTGFLRDWVSPGNDLRHMFDTALVRTGRTLPRTA